MDDANADPRLRGWRERLATRSEEALDALGAARGVVGLVLGGSVGRGGHWPLSDLDVIVVSAGRPVAEVADDIDRRAYQLSEMWGTSGIYTAVDAGRLTFDETEVWEPGDIGSRMADSRWMHGLDKIYGGLACRDNDGAAAALLRLSTDWRFDQGVVGRRIEAWRSAFEQLLADADRLGGDDRTGAWIAIRRAATSLAEAATDRWGERAGSLGRFWTHFEARAARHGEADWANRLLVAAWANPRPLAVNVPEWLADRIGLSFQARLLIGEKVTPEQNVRDNLLAYTGLYRSRFPTAAYDWMTPPPDADPRVAAHALRTLSRDVWPDTPG